MPYLDKAAHDKMKREEMIENNLKDAADMKEGKAIDKIINKLNENASEFKRTTYNDYLTKREGNEKFIDRVDFWNRNMTSSVVFYKTRYGISFTIIGTGISYHILKLSYKRTKLYNKLFRIGYFDDHDML